MNGQIVSPAARTSDLLVVRRMTEWIVSPALSTPDLCGGGWMSGQVVCLPRIPDLRAVAAG
jgi:hypothetical protein